MAPSRVDWLGVLHLAAALVSLASGAVVVWLRKGGRRHIQAGWVYVAAMAVVNVTALAIYDLFGRFGPFHVAALISAVTTVAGVVAARRRLRRWVEVHARLMAWSYVGLVAAAAAETATRYLRFDFGVLVVTATLVVVGVGAMIIERRVPKTVAVVRRRS